MQIRGAARWPNACVDSLEGHLAIAYFYERADNSTFRYRIYNMVQAIDGFADEVTASYFFLEDLDRLTEISDRADMLVICRTRYDSRVNQLVTAFRRQRKPVLFDIDDLVFNTDYVHIIIKALRADTGSPKVWDDWFAYVSRLGTTLKLCDRALTTNGFLAERIREFAGIPVSVIPNFLNREQLALSEQVYAARRAADSEADGAPRIGYFSGSPSHAGDFELVAPHLEAVLEQHPALRLMLVGYVDEKNLRKRFGSRISTIGFQDFVNLQRLIGSVTLSLAPLQYNVFTNSKSELKYFEAAVVGTITIASPTYAYSSAISDGENGYIAQAHEWSSVISRALHRRALEHGRA